MKLLKKLLFQILLVCLIFPRLVFSQESTPSASLTSAPTASSTATVKPTATSTVTPTPTLIILPTVTPLMERGDLTVIEAAPEAGASSEIKGEAQIILDKETSEPYSADEAIKGEVLGVRAYATEISVTDSDGNGTNLEIQKIILDNNEIAVQILPPREFKPGKFTLKATDGGEEISRDFSWGVLAINSNKSYYLPEETAKLAFAVLDDAGHVICNSKLELRVTSYELRVDDKLSTEDGTIKVSETCQDKNYTLIPDYSAEYKLKGAGKYLLNLTAETANGKYTIDDSFEVKEALDFEIERISATRIYPPANYPVTLKIKANKDFKGKVKEFIPNSFEIFNFQFSIFNKFQISNSNDQKSKELIWEVDWKEGRTYELEYQFKAPEISPQFYLLGPLQLTEENGQTVFQEGRQWQIAADLIITPVVRAVGTIAGSASAISPGLPAGTTTGDLLLMFVENSGEAAQTAVGWTQVDYQAITASSLTVLYRIATGSDATTTNDVGNHQIGRIVGIQTGTFDPAAPFGAATLVKGTETSGTAKTIGGITTTVDNSLVIAAIAGDLPDGAGTANWANVGAAGGWTNANLTGLAEQIDNSDNPGTGGSIGVATGVKAAAAATGNTTVTAASGRSSAHMMFAIKGIVVTAAISGTVYTNEAKSLDVGAGATVHLFVNGDDKSTVETTAGGAYTFSAVTNIAASDSVIVYLDGETVDGSTITLAVGASNAISTLDIITRRVSLEYRAGSSITNTDLNDVDEVDAGDEDGLTIGGGTALTVGSSMELLVLSTYTFAPGANVTAEKLHIKGTYTGAAETLELTGSGTGACDAVQAETRPLCIDSGTFTTPATTKFSGTGASYIEASKATNDYDNLTLAPSGGSNPTYTLGTAGSQGVDVDGVLTVGDGTNLVTVNATANDPTINVNGNFILSDNTAWTASDTAAFTFDGSSQSWTDSNADSKEDLGLVTVDGSTLTVTLGSSVKATKVTVTDILSLANSSYSLTITGSGQTTSRPFIVNGTLTENTNSSVIYTGSSATDIEDETYASLTLNNGATTFSSMGNIGVGGTFTITAGAFDANDDTITLSGVGTVFVNNGTLTEDASTFKYTGNGTTNILKETYYNLSIHPGGAVTHRFAAETTTVTGTLSVGDGANAGTADANTNGATVTVSGAMIINASGVFQADDANTLSVAGNFTNNGTFTNNGGTTSFTGATGSTQTIDGATAFGALSITGGNRIVKFGADDTFSVAADKNLTLTGGSDCFILLIVRSTTKGTKFTLTDNAGGVTTVSYIDLQDAGDGGTISALNSVNSGNNHANWSIAANACLGASSDSNPTAYSWQRKTFHDETNNVHWQFFHDGDQIEIRYSSNDGTTWNVDTSLDYDSNDFSVWWASLAIGGSAAEEYVFLAVNDSGDIKVRQGTMTASAITWDADVSVALNESGTYSYPYLTLDSSEYLWVGARYNSGSNYVFKTALTAQTADNDPVIWTWTTTPYQISDDQIGTNVFGNIVSIGARDMYATFAVNGALEGCVWDSSDSAWEDTATGATCAVTSGTENVVIEQQINIIDQVYNTTGTAQPTDNSLGLILWDGTKYNGETVYFEAVIYCDTCSGGNNRVLAGLYADDGGLAATVFTSSASYIRVRSDAITANLTDNKEYTVRLTRDATAGTAYIKAARLIVVQSAPTITDTQTQIEVGDVESSLSGVYVALTNPKIFLWDKDKCSGNVQIYFEASFISDESATVASAALSSDGCSTTVTSSPLTDISAAMVRLRSGSLTLTDDTVYQVCIKGDGSRGINLKNAKIIIEQTTNTRGLTDIEMVHQLNNTLAIDTDSTYTAKYYDNKFDDTNNWAGGTFAAYFESTLKTSNAAGAYYAILESDGVEIASSEITASDTSYTRKRDTDNMWSLLTDGANFDVKLKNDSTYTTSSSNSWLVIQASGLPGGVKIDDAGDPGAIIEAGRQTVRTLSGNLYAVINDGGSCEVWKSVDNGATWEEQDGDDNPACDSDSTEKGVALAIDGSDNLHIIYRDDTENAVRYIGFTASNDQFGSEETVDSTVGSSGGQAFDITIDSANKPHVVYEDINDVYYSNRILGSWKAQVTVDTAVVVADSISVVTNEDDIIETSYLDTNQSDLITARGNQNDATAFNDVYTINAAMFANIKASLAVDSSGNTWVGYYDSGVYLVKHNDADTWNTWQPAITDSNTGSTAISLAILDEDIYVFYEDDNNHVVYDKYNGNSAAWVGEKILARSIGGKSYQNVKAKWSYLNNFSGPKIDFLYSDGTDIYWDQLDVAGQINDDSDFDDPIGSGRQIVRTSNGILYAVVNDVNAVEVWKSIDGSSWTQQDSLDSPVSNDTEVTIAIDSSNNIHILYKVTSNGIEWDIRWIRFLTSTGQFDSSSGLAYDGSGGCGSFDIAIDNSDIPHISFGYGSGVGYNNRIGDTWNETPLIIEAVVPGTTNGTSITINEDSKPEVVYINATNDQLTGAQGDANDPATFSLYDIDGTTNDTNNQRGCSIGIDSSGNTWVAGIDSDSTVDLYKHTNGTTWDSAGNWIAASNSNVGYEPSIAVNGSDVYILYEDNNDDLVYDKYDGSSWSGETVLESGTFQDVKARWSYKNNVSYTTYGFDYLFSDNTDVFYNYFPLVVTTIPGTQDSIAAAITIGSSYGVSTLADSSGYVHLVYINSGTQAVYQRRTTSWQSAVTLDDTAGGEYPSIAIDTAGSNGMYAFWIRDNDIFYRRACSTYTSWGDPVTLESAGTNDWITFGYEDGGSGKIFGGWTTGSAAPLFTKWSAITPTTCAGGVETPAINQLLRHGLWFNSSGVKQPFTF